MQEELNKNEEEDGKFAYKIEKAALFRATKKKKGKK